MATYFTLADREEYLIADVRDDSEVANLVNKAEATLLDFFHGRLDTTKEGFDVAMKYAIGEQALELWREKDPTVRSESMLGKTVQYTTWNRVSPSAKAWLSRFARAESVTGVQHLDFPVSDGDSPEGV